MIEIPKIQLQSLSVIFDTYEYTTEEDTIEFYDLL